MAGGRRAGGRAALVLLGARHTIAGVLAAWCLAQAGLNALQASLSAAVPDHVPVTQRGAVSGWIGLPQSVGVLLAVVLVTDVASGSAGYALLAACAVACVLPFALGTPDPPRHGDLPPWQWRAFARPFWLSPRRHPDFAWAWLTRFAVNLGNSMTLLYLLYFLRDRLHYSRLFPGHKAADGLVILILAYLAGVGPQRDGRRRDLRPNRLTKVLVTVPAWSWRSRRCSSRCGRPGQWPSPPPRSWAWGSACTCRSTRRW